MPVAPEKLNDRYQLIECLAENAGQQTWSAIDSGSQSGDRVIVKLLAMNPQMPWEQAKLLEREAQILRTLNHPQIPQYRDYFILDQVSGSRFPWFCLVQTQVPGTSLQQLLEDGYRFPQLEVKEIAIQVLSILSDLHRLNPPILHRDIKPSNLIRGEEGRIYLIDFGSVQDQAALEGATFTVVGTYGYVPMEQFGGRAVPASDLYALGATLIHLLTGVSPADLPRFNGRLQFAGSLGVDRVLINWVEKLTEPDVENRFPTADVALNAWQHRSRLSLPLLNRKPTGSNIQLQKSVRQLNITIPPRGLQELSWGYSGTALLAVLILFYRLQTGISRGFINWWPVWLMLSIGFWMLIDYVIKPICSSATETLISANHHYFTIQWKIFGFVYWKRRAKINEIWINPEISSTGKSIVKIYVGKKAFGTNPMAEVEQKWLIQEISDWLAAR
jgi:serine/threonine protein kinase